MGCEVNREKCHVCGKQAGKELRGAYKVAPLDSNGKPIWENFRRRDLRFFICNSCYDVLVKIIDGGGIE